MSVLHGRGISAVACTHFCVRALVCTCVRIKRNDCEVRVRHWRRVCKPPLLKWHQNQKGLYKCFFIERVCFHCLYIANRPLPLTMPQAAQQLVRCGWQRPRLSLQDVNQCEVIHTADEWGLRQAEGLYQGQIWVETVCRNLSRLQPKLEELCTSAHLRNSSEVPKDKYAA